MRTRRRAGLRVSGFLVASLVGAAAAAAEDARPTPALLGETNAKVEQFAYSPDGRQIAYVSARGGTYGLWVIGSDGGEARLITGGNPAHQAFDSATISPEWSPDGRWIAYVSRGDIHIVRPDGSAPPINVTYGTGGLRPRWTPDSRWILSAPGGESVTAYAQILRHRGDIPGGALERTALTDGPYTHGDPRPSPDGKWIAFTSARPAEPGGPRRSGIWLMPAGGGAPRLLLASAGTPRWSPDSRRLAYVVTSEAGWRNVGVADVATGASRMVTASAWDEGNPQWSPDGRVIAYVANRVRSMQLMSVPADGSAPPRALTDAPGVNGGWETGQVRGTFRWSPDGRWITYTHMDAGRCSDLWRIPAGGGTPQQLTDHMPAGLRGHRFVTPELIDYRTRDGLDIQGFLYRPPAPAPGRLPPLLLRARANVHGMHVDGFYPFIQYFVARGYVVFCPQVRGSGGFGRAFERRNFGDWGGHDVDDYADAVGALAARGLIDPRRVVMQGGSTGGYHTMMTIVRYPDLVRAAVNFYGPTNLVHMDDYSITKATLAGVVRGDHGGPAEAPEHWRSRSAFYNIDRIRTPLLILWGDLDAGVRQTQAAEYVAAARAKGKPTDYVLYDGEPHGWYNWRPATLADAITRVAAHYAAAVSQ